MKQIVSTLNVFLKQEWITVGVYSIATCLFLIMIFQMGSGVTAEDGPEFGFRALLMIAMLSIFVGIYLGSGFLRLQQSHLWQIHSGYRSTLVISLILAAFIYETIQFYPMLYAGWSWSISLFAPVCITLLSAQLVIGSNLIMKFILPATPFVLVQLTKFEIDNHAILLLLIIFSGLAVYLNATNRRRIDNATLGLMSGNMQQQMNSLPIQKLNNLIADFFEFLHARVSKQDLSIAMLQPTNRFGLFSSLVALLCLLSFHFMGAEKIEFEAFGAMLLASMTLGVFIELKLLARQTKTLAHVFSNDHHQQLKKKILITVEKHILTQTSVFVVLMMIVSLLIDDFVDPLLMIKMGFTIAIIAAAFLPTMLCLNWFNINFKLIGVVIVYAATSLIFAGWQYSHSLTDTLSLPFFAAILLLGLIRWGSVYLWKRQSVEQFLRVYG